MIADAWIENRECSAYLSALLDNEKLYFNDVRNETQKIRHHSVKTGISAYPAVMRAMWPQDI